MRALWTSAAAGVATKGRLTGPCWNATGISIDSRTLQPGDLFVALTDIRDGHEFVEGAFSKGAAAALVSHVPEGVDATKPLLVVDNVLAALERLGAEARARTQAIVIAVTGSAGKTSTKEMLLHVLGAQGRTHASFASYNNHWGVPLTLARMPDDTEYAVIEIGMNQPGEIEPLSRITHPHVAIVTTVAPAHLEAFESIEKIAEEKATIFRGLEPGGTAIFNADIDTAPLLNAEAKLYAGRRIGFGEHEDAALHANKITLTDTASVVEGRFAGAPFLLKVGAPGRHFAMNALAVFGVAQVVGADKDVAACDLGLWQVPAGRGKRETIILDPVEDYSVEVLDDAFNANPSSVAAALEVLATIMPGKGQGHRLQGRRIAILGDMLELGPNEAAFHVAIANLPSVASVDTFHCVGSRMRVLYEALPGDKRGVWAQTADQLAREVHHLIEPGDVILVKGSKSSKVSRICETLRRLAKTPIKEDEKGLA